LGKFAYDTRTEAKVQDHF